MPLCPGCRRRVAYGDLPAHQRYCRRIWECEPVTGGAWDDHLADAVEGLDDRTADGTAIARLERRVRRLESAAAPDDE